MTIDNIKPIFFCMLGFFSQAAIASGTDGNIVEPPQKRVCGRVVDDRRPLPDAGVEPAAPAAEGNPLRRDDVPHAFFPLQQQHLLSYRVGHHVGQKRPADDTK